MTHPNFSFEPSLPTRWTRLRQKRGPLVAVLLLAALVLSACLSLLGPTGPVRTPVVLPPASGDQAQIAISPPSGYAGVYVQVVGNGWPANDLVLVVLSDDAGRSGILAASAANSNGQVTTGFLYPISPRWLSPGSHTIVAYTSNGNLQASAEFQVTPGEGVTPGATSQSTTPTATATGPVIQTPTATSTSGAVVMPTPSATATAVSAPTPIVISEWRGDYWANSTLSGDAALVRNDAAVFFDWGSGSPAPGLPAEQFSARWTRQLSFDAGVYNFFLEVDDGARLFIDDQLVLDEWRTGSQRMASATVSLAAGRHNLRVEYFERTGLALARFWWERQVTFTGWEGRYFTNPDLQGDPAVVRDDATINFDWGNGGPVAGVGADNFSVRWKRTVAFNPGRYRFYARMDDGLRVRVDGQLLLDEWRDGSDRIVATDVELPGGNYQIEVDYYERTGGALAGFWWELAPEPTPTYTPLWTSTPTATDAPSATPTATDMPSQTPTPSPEATFTSTWTPTATPVVEPSETVTVVASSGTPTPVVETSGLSEIGETLPFTRMIMAPLLSPKLGIYEMIVSDGEWSTLLDSLRPPKMPRPALRSTPVGRGGTATPVLPVVPGGLSEQVALPILPDFSQEVVLVAILGADRMGESVQIVDVRRDADDLFVMVRIQPQVSRILLAEGGVDAVIVPRDFLLRLEDMTVHFVDESYQLLTITGTER